MNQTDKQSNSKLDDQLADFADQVIQGKRNQPASHLTDNLLGLEETILRLNNSLPPSSLDDASVKQMHVRLKARIRREEQKKRLTFWEKWFGAVVSPQLGLAFAALAVLVVVIVSFPSITSVSPTPATATNPVNIFIGLGVIGAMLIILWFGRRK